MNVIKSFDMLIEHNIRQLMNTVNNTIEGSSKVNADIIFRLDITNQKHLRHILFLLLPRTFRYDHRVGSVRDAYFNLEPYINLVFWSIRTKNIDHSKIIQR